MAIRIGVVPAVVVRETVGLRPAMLPVVEVVPPAFLWDAGVLVEVEDVVGILGILVRFL